MILEVFSKQNAPIDVHAEVKRPYAMEAFLSLTLPSLWIFFLILAVIVGAWLRLNILSSLCSCLSDKNVTRFP